METREFLPSMFRDKRPEDFILIWELETKRSSWFQDASRATAYSEGKGDVYFGLGISPKDYGRARRCRTDQVCGIAGLWADIDLAGPNHKSSNLPKDATDLKLALADIPRPSIVVASGGGVHCYWLFDKAWYFADGSNDRERASVMETALVHAIRANCAKHGWKLDGVQDLARVLRVPGTFNGKNPSRPTTVKFVSAPESPDLLVRYTVDALTDALRANIPQSSTFSHSDTQSGRTAPSDAKQRHSNHVTEDTFTKMPFEKFDMLASVEPRFRQTWEHARKDLNDTSLSSFDYSLANFALQAGWTDEEIRSLLIAHRKKWCADLKYDGYYTLTIQNARKTTRSAVAMEMIGEIPSKEDDNRPQEQRNADILATLSDRLGIELTHVIRYTSDPPQYRIETDTGSVMLGGVRGLIEESLFRNAVADCTRHFLPSIKKEWGRIAQLLLDCCEDVSLGDGSTSYGQIAGWIDEYLDEHTVLESADLISLAPFKTTHNAESRTVIVGPEFKKWIASKYDEKIDGKELGRLFRLFGAEPKTMPFKKSDDSYTTRYCWILPKGTK
jgi:hypothetical protein